MSSSYRRTTMAERLDDTLLWQRVESALVGGLSDGMAKFAIEVATGNYHWTDVQAVAQELKMVLLETNPEYYSKL
jgi:hypothetical protein